MIIATMSWKCTITYPDPVTVSSGTAFFSDSHSVCKVGTDVFKVGTDVFKVGTDVFMAR